MKILTSEQDFMWYKRKIDADGKYEYQHNGKPEKYPCKAVSRFWDDPNGPYNYDHIFIYQQVVLCSECGHKTTTWPEIDKDDLI